jgi:hypothetical protein
LTYNPPDRVIPGPPDHVIPGLPDHVIPGLPDHVIPGLPDHVIPGPFDHVIPGLPDHVIPGLDPGIATSAGICGDPRVKPDPYRCNQPNRWESQGQRHLVSITDNESPTNARKGAIFFLRYRC